MRLWLIALLVLAATFSAAPSRLLVQDEKTSVDEAFRRFWAAGSPDEAAKAANDVVRSGVRFDEAWKRLKAGRSYTGEKGGVLLLRNRTNDGFNHNYAINVPKDYDPAKSYQVRFQFHGGLSARQNNQPQGTGEIGALAGTTDQFYVLPYAWNRTPWWSEDELLNIDTILDQMKRTYNIDENRVVISGTFDGGTGAYYFAMCDTTPFASFLPLSGFVLVLAEDMVDDGQIFPSNLLNKPMFVVNGGRDPIYPAALVEPAIKDLVDSGADISYHPLPDARHDTSWWPEIRDDFETFVTEHPRQPHPERITWETNNLEHNRAHWLVIDKLDPRDTRAGLLLGPAPLESFFRKRVSGRVTVSRSGNRIVALSRGVAQFTLLLSPDAFDFNQPIQVILNGHVEFEGRVQPSVETLLKWAARDNDRTMLYGAELHLSVDTTH